MPEWALCKTTECPKRYKCKRFTTTPKLHWQRYEDYYLGKEPCENYIPLREERDND